MSDVPSPSFASRRAMKALSIQQPWAWVILYGTKRVENRTWWTRFRGEFLIHAGLRADRAALDALRDEIEAFPPPRPPAVCGALLGVARMVGQCLPDEVSSDQRGWANGPACFLLADVVPFAEPIPYKGALGFFDVPYDVVRNAIIAAREPKAEERPQGVTLPETPVKREKDKKREDGRE